MLLPSRAISNKYQILSPAEIPLAGFGDVKVTRRLNGAIVTETIPRIYQLCCGCYVNEYRQCGGVCHYCRMDLEMLNAHIEHAYQLNSMQMDWMSTPCNCNRHYHTCQYPFCGRGCCSRHSTMLEDGKIYCLDHYMSIKHELEIAEKKATQGVVIYKISTFVKSLFFKQEQ